MEKFGKRVGITRSSVCKLESGENNPAEQTIMLICKEFNINEIWLRTGTGEMNATNNLEERYAMNLEKLRHADNETIIRWVNSIAETDPDILKQIETFIKALLNIDTSYQNPAPESVETAEAAYIKSRSKNAKNLDGLASSSTAEGTKTGTHDTLG